MYYLAFVLTLAGHYHGVMSPLGAVTLEECERQRVAEIPHVKMWVRDRLGSGFEVDDGHCTTDPDSLRGERL